MQQPHPRKARRTSRGVREARSPRPSARATADSLAAADASL